MTFSKKIQAQFKLAGWHEGRKDSRLKTLLKEKYNYPEVALNFLEEFGNLRVENVVNIEPVAIDFRLNLPELDLAYAMGSIDSEISFFVEKFGFPLYYLGEHTPHSWFVCCDDAGRVYKLADLCFYCGNTIEKGIENILTHGKDDSIVYEDVSNTWHKRSEDYLGFTPIDFEAWVLDH